MAGGSPSLSYVTPQSTTASLGTGTIFVNDEGAVKLDAALDPLRWVESDEGAKFVDGLAKEFKGEFVRGTGMKLVHYVIVDVDKRWLKEVPHKAILDSEMVVMADERSFLLGLNVTELLASHNAERREVTYEDKDGEEKHFKDIGADKIDVVINVLKEW